MDLVFKALSDPLRRSLLDRLFQRDGQTLGQLCAESTLTRFGVMKHLRVLEAAHLVTTRRVGREKLHYLNPVPLQLIHDRWVSKYAAPFTAAMSQLKQQLEGITMSNEKAVQVYEVYIRTTPERLWQAITDPAFTSQYFFGSSVHSDLKVGSPFVYKFPDGSVGVDGEVIEADPPRKLVHTWTMLYDPAMAKERSRVTWLIQQLGEACKLTAIHELPEAPVTAKHVAENGWTVVLSGLKTYLETGKPLVVDMPLPA